MTFDAARFAREWPEQQERWRQFADHEAEWDRQHPSSLAEKTAWFSDAWELARRFDPDWGSEGRAREHWEELAKARERLAEIRSRT